MEVPVLGCQGYYALWTECYMMATWAGCKCGSPCATCAGIDGYPKPRTHQIALARSAGQLCGTRMVLMAGLVRHGSRRGAGTGQSQRRNTDGGFYCAFQNIVTATPPGHSSAR